VRFLGLSLRRAVRTRRSKSSGVGFLLGRRAFNIIGRLKFRTISDRIIHLASIKYARRAMRFTASEVAVFAFHRWPLIFISYLVC
jgi:hypothetical protein